MTENDPAATFRLDQQEAADAAAQWEAIRVQEATTTLEQRQALTRRVNAQTALLEFLNVLGWVALSLTLTFLVVAGFIAAFQGVFG